MVPETSTRLPARRSYSKAFKAQILRACAEPGASLSGIAVAHGLNPNIVQRWRREARRGELVLPDAPQFIPIVASSAPQARELHMAAHGDSPVIELQLQRGALRAQVRWPAQAAGECAAFLRELLR